MPMARRVILSAGSELTLFMRGIVPGDTVIDRVGKPLRLVSTVLRLKTDRHRKPLDSFVRPPAQPLAQIYPIGAHS